MVIYITMNVNHDKLHEWLDMTGSNVFARMLYQRKYRK